MDQRTNSGQAHRQGQQLLESSILRALVLGMYCHGDAQRPEVSNLSTEKRKIVGFERHVRDEEIYDCGPRD